MTEVRKLWVQLETDVWMLAGTDGSVERVVVDYDVRRPFDGITGDSVSTGDFGPREPVGSLTDDEVEQLDLAADHVMSAAGFPVEAWEVGPLGEVAGTLSKSLFTERRDIWEAALKRGCGHGCGCMKMLRQDLESRGIWGQLERGRADDF